MKRLNNKGQASIFGLILVAAVAIMIVAGVLPVLINPSSSLPVNRLLSALGGYGYTAYATPAGDFYVNNLYPNADDTYDIGKDDTRFQDIFFSGSLDKERSDGTGGYWHEYRFDVINLAKGASGATFIVPTSDTLGGYRLDASTEYLYFASHIEHDWDGISDGLLDIGFEVGLDNTAGSVSDVVVLTIEHYHKAFGDTTTSPTTHNGSAVVGQSSEWKFFEMFIPVNDLEPESTMSFRISLDTTLSDVDNVILVHIEFKYPTRHPALEVE